MTTLEYSVRAHIDSTTEFCPFRAPADGFDKSAPLVPPYLILVHGYHCGYGETREGYDEIEEQVEYALGSPDSGWSPGTIIEFFWPGSWSATVGFGAAWARAKEAGRRLNYLINFLENATRGVSPRACRGGLVRVLAHSMGARVALESQRLETSRLTGLYLCNAAIDHDCLAPGAEYGNLIRVSAVHVFFSRRDPVCKYAYRVGRTMMTGNLWHPLEWFEPALGAVGSPAGAHMYPVFNHDCSNFPGGERHGGIKRMPILYDFLLKG